MLIPIGDENYGDKKPVLNYILIGLNVAVYLFVTLPASVESYNGVVLAYGVDPGKMSLMTFITSMFLHGGLFHLIGNMLFLYVFGDNIERKLGHVGYFFFYMGTGIAAGLAFGLTGEPGIPAIGASGAVSGVLGAYIFFFKNNKIKVFYWFFFFIGTFHITAIWGLGIWIGIDILRAMAEQGDSVGAGVAYMAHIGGFAAGLLTAYALYLFGIARPGERPASSRHVGWDHVTAQDWRGRSTSWKPGHRATRREPRPASSIPVKMRSPESSVSEITGLVDSEDFMALAAACRKARFYFGSGALPPELEEKIARRALAEGRFLIAADSFSGLVKNHGASPNLGYYHAMLGIIHADHLDNFALARQHLKKAFELENEQKLLSQVESHIEALDAFFKEPVLSESPGNSFTILAVGGTEVPATNVGRLVAGHLSLKEADAVTQIHTSGGIIAENAPGDAAETITRQLNKGGIPVVAVPQEAFLPLPSAEELKFAISGEEGLAFKDRKGAQVLFRWDDVHVVNAMRLERRGYSGWGGATPGMAGVLDIVTANPARRLRFSEVDFTPSVDERGEITGFDFFALGVAVNGGAGIYGPDVIAAALGGEWRRGPQGNYTRFDRQTQFLLQRAQVRLVRQQ
jgi:membrane associated rhomboid family serine protease